MVDQIRQVVVVSDLHCGCQVGLCPPKVALDSGGVWSHGPTQKAIWEVWSHFWTEWVPRVTRGEPYAVVVNGDAMDGAHHRSKTQITQNFADQIKIAYEVLAPVRDACDGRFYMVRGTEAHVGQCAENEEMLAQSLDAVRNDLGNASSYDLWMDVGNRLVHFTHHIGTTSRMAYETSALMGEYTEMLATAARWRRPAPDFVVRSHRHQHIQITAPTANVYGTTFTTPAWQGRTPYVWKVARISETQVGGSLIRVGDEEAYTRHFVRALERSQTIDITEVRDAV